jgi:hypothetical protein
MKFPDSFRTKIRMQGRILKSWLGKGGPPSSLDSDFLSELHVFFMIPGAWNDGFRRGMGNRCQSLTLGNEISYSVKTLNRTGEASLVVSRLNRCTGPVHSR